MFKNNRNLLIIALIAVVNALGYAIIIPVLYSYSQKFGLSDFQNGLLFALFSVCQFISTPFIGRLSDKFGRKPLLIISLIGTAISFFMMAFAPSAIVLFLARALDGITAGNIPVAAAVISDTTEPKDRARGFGIIGASFGFGFIFGPAIAAMTVGFGDAVPFVIAGIVTIVSVVITFLLLPETNKAIGQVQKGPLIDVVKLVKAVTDENIGITLLISLMYAFAFSLFIYAWQPLGVKELHLTVQQISIAFTLFGIVGLVAQVAVIPRVVKVLGDKRSLIISLLLLSGSYAAFFVVNSYVMLLVISVIESLANAFVLPLIQTILSKATDEKSQGSILGLNQSYYSIGQIVGPIVGGAVATLSIPMPFLVGSAVCFACAILSFNILTHKHIKPTSL